MVYPFGTEWEYPPPPRMVGTWTGYAVGGTPLFADTFSFTFISNLISITCTIFCGVPCLICFHIYRIFEHSSMRRMCTSNQVIMSLSKCLENSTVSTIPGWFLLFRYVIGNTHFYSARCIFNKVVTFYTHFCYFPTSRGAFAHFGKTPLHQKELESCNLHAQTTSQAAEMSTSIISILLHSFTELLWCWPVVSCINHSNQFGSAFTRIL